MKKIAIDLNDIPAGKSVSDIIKQWEITGELDIPYTELPEEETKYIIGCDPIDTENKQEDETAI